MTAADHNVALLLCDAILPDKAVSAIRTAKLANELAASGWCVVVLKRSALFSPRLDRARAGQVLILKSATTEAKGKTRSRLRALIGNVIIPRLPPYSRWRSWCTDRAAESIDACVREYKPKVLITSVPPFSLNYAAELIVQRYPNIRWLADFRDPLVIDNRFRPPSWSMIFFPSFRTLERRVFEHAHMVAFAIPIHFRYSRRAHPEWAAKFKLVPNELSVVRNRPETIARLDPTKTKMVSMGKFDPRALCKLIRLFGILHNHRFEIRIATFQEVNAKTFRSLPKNVTLEFIGAIDHDKALREIMGADVCLSLLSKKRSSSYALSLKMIEYDSLEKPCIAVNPTRSDRLWARKRSEVICIGENESSGQRVVSEFLAKCRCDPVHASQVQSDSAASDHSSVWEDCVNFLK